jgi:energy-coupling factor transport system substrate-specific component
MAVLLVGSFLYAFTIFLTAILNIPGSDNVQLRPGVAIPILCGALFGPAAGFVTGFAGNLAADQFLGWGWWPFWYVGNGIMGAVSGMARAPKPDYSRMRTAIGVVWRAAIGITIGMGFASLSEHWFSNTSWSDIWWNNFLPAFLSNLVNVTILVPIILLLYGFLQESTASDIG